MAAADRGLTSPVRPLQVRSRNVARPTRRPPSSRGCPAWRSSLSVIIARRPRGTTKRLSTDQPAQQTTIRRGPRPPVPGAAAAGVLLGRHHQPAHEEAPEDLSALDGLPGQHRLPLVEARPQLVPEAVLTAPRGDRAAQAVQVLEAAPPLAPLALRRRPGPRQRPDAA